MGFFRSAGLILTIILLFVSIFLGGVLLTLSLSLNYDNVKENGVSVMEEIIVSQAGINLTEEIENVYPLIEQSCEYNSQYTFEYGGYDIEINCSELDEGPESLIHNNFENFFEEVYYRDYDCEFWNCFGEENSGIPLFLVSQKAQNYWQSKLYFSLLISLALMILIFLLVKRKRNFFIISGAVIILTSIPFLKVERLVPGSNVIISSLLRIFASESRTILFIGIISGIVLLIFGVLLYISGFKRFIQKIINFFRRNKKEEKVVEKNNEEKVMEKSNKEKVNEKKKD